jgi:hemerythrin-like domain-containing protein
VLNDLTVLATHALASTARRESAGRIIQFFDDVVTTHHREEETDLFPAVLADAIGDEERTKVARLIDQLVNEHRRVEREYAHLLPYLADITHDGKAPLDASATATLVTDYLAHARFEEEAFLPLAQTILGRNSNHMAALGLSLHIRHATDDVRRRFGFI